MSARPLSVPSPLQILDRRRIRTDGVSGVRYRLRRDHAFTGDADLDRALSTFDAIVLPPTDGRSDAAMVSLLSGITRGMEQSLPAATALARSGVGAVLFDTPLGGARRAEGGHPGLDLAAMVQRGLPIDVSLVRRVFDGVAADLPEVLDLAEAEHALTGRRALFGISFGCLLSSLAFARDGVGDRLYGVIGHPDLSAMSRGMVATFTRFSGLPAAVVAGGLRLGPVAEAAARRFGGDGAVGALRFARALDAMGKGGRTLDGLDPIRFAPDVSASRAVHFLAGERDPVAPPDEIRASAQAFASSSVEVVPGLGHGWYPGAPPVGAPPFGQATADWIRRGVADWLA